MNWTLADLHALPMRGDTRVVGEASRPHQRGAAPQEGISLVLPYPPSSNTLYPTGKDGRRHLSAEGRAYHLQVTHATWNQWPHAVERPISGRLVLSVWFYPPDRRRRDTSNVPKILEDALTAAGAWLDDSQIDELHLYRRAVVAVGYVEVLIQEKQLCSSSS